MNAHEPLYDELCLRTERHDDMEDDMGADHIEVLRGWVTHAAHEDLNRAIGIISAEMDARISKHNEEGRKLAAISRKRKVRQVGKDRAERKDAGGRRTRKELAKELGMIREGVRCEENSVGADPFEVVR